MARTPFYQFTIDPSTVTGRQRLAGLRSEVSIANAALKKIGLVERLRVSTSPRLGKNNKYAWKYDNRFRPRLRAEDAKTFDVYLSLAAGPRRRTESRPKT